MLCTCFVRACLREIPYITGNNTGKCESLVNERLYTCVRLNECKYIFCPMLGPNIVTVDILFSPHGHGVKKHVRCDNAFDTKIGPHIILNFIFSGI